MLFFELFPAFRALVCFAAALSLFIANWHATHPAAGADDVRRGTVASSGSTAEEAEDDATVAA